MANENLFLKDTKLGDSTMDAGRLFSNGIVLGKKLNFGVFVSHVPLFLYQKDFIVINNSNQARDDNLSIWFQWFRFILNFNMNGFCPSYIYQNSLEIRRSVKPQDTHVIRQMPSNKGVSRI